MALTASTQAAAEYVALLGRSAVVTAQNLAQSAYRVLEDHPTAFAVGGAVLIVLIWLTRSRRG